LDLFFLKERGKLPFIPPEFIEEINRRLDIVDLVSKYVSLKKQGRNFIGLCPFHSEKTPSFIVSPEKQIYHCFGCHAGGNGINFLMQIENLSFPEAIEKLADSFGIEIPRQKLSPIEEAKIQERKNYFEINSIARDFYQEYLWSKAGDNARGYLENRGLTAEIVKKFALGYAPDNWDTLLKYLLKKGYSHKQIESAGLITLREGMNENIKAYDRFRDRVMYPILDYKGQVVGFGGRILSSDPKQAKYLNSPETAFFHKSQNLYGLFTAGNSIRKLDEVVIMEGYMDVIAAHQFGVENAVAALGTAFTAEHAKLLRRYSNNVLLAFDGDEAGVKAANKSMDILKNLDCNLRVLHFPDNKDPDEFIREKGKLGWEEYISENALDFWGYKLKQGLKNNDINTISGKSHLVEELMPYMRSCNNKVELESFVNLLAKTLGISVNSIYADLRKSKGHKIQLQENVSSVEKVQDVPAEKITPPDRYEANLVLFMLYDEGIFEKVENLLGFDFTNHKCLQELMTLIKNLKKDYSWNPSTLFSYIEDNDTKELLLKMLDVDINVGHENYAELADGIINKIIIKRKRQEIEEKQDTLKNLTKLEDSKQLLSDILTLQQDIRKLQS
jgi:DNA primase